MPSDLSYRIEHSWKCLKCHSVYTEPDNRPVPTVRLCRTCKDAIVRDWCDRDHTTYDHPGPLPALLELTPDRLLVLVDGKPVGHVTQLVLDAPATPGGGPFAGTVHIAGPSPATMSGAIQLFRCPS